MFEMVDPSGVVFRGQSRLRHGGAVWGHSLACRPGLARAGGVGWDAPGQGPWKAGGLEGAGADSPP